MKTIIATALIALISACAGAQTDVLFTLSDFNAYPTTNRTVSLRKMQPFLGDEREYSSSSVGYFYASNQAAGDYAVTIKQKGSARAINFQITVTATNLGVVSAYEITSVSGVATYPTAGKSAWSIAASDARYTNSGASSGTTYTNNSTGLPGVIVGSGIGTNLHAFGAVTNNDTRNVNLLGEIVTVGSGASAGIVVHGQSSEIRVTGDIRGSGVYLTNFTDASLPSTLTRDTELTAANTVVSNGVVTGLGDGSFVVGGNGASITNLNADELRSGTVPLARLSGITATQVADASLTTNKVDATFHALLGGGGSGDVTEAGLAAGSYVINGVLATNLIEATGAYSPQHFNIGKTPVLNGLIRSNLPVRMLVFGDDAFIPTTGIIAAFTNMGYKVNGTGGGSSYQIGNYAYAVAAGTTTYIQSDGVANPYVIGTVGMANGSSLTNVVELGQLQGIDTDRIAIKYWQNAGFGTLGVYTNSYGSTPTLFTTIDCNVGSFTYAVTNFDMPARISNCVVSVRSVGTNFVPVASMAQWKTNGQILRLDQYTGGQIGIFNFTESAIKSNIFRTLLTDFDVLVVSDLGGGDYAYGTNLWNMIKANNLKLDVVVSTSVIQSNNGAYDSREFVLNIGRTTPFVVVDTASLLAPTNAATLNYLYNDASHLSRMGQAYAGEKFVNALGWNADNFRQSLPNQTTNYFFIAADELRNQSGALSLSDIYTVLGAPYRTWAHYVAAGTYGANSTLVYPGNQLGQRKRIYARMLVLTTNAISYSLLLNHAVFPVGANITSWSVPVNDLGSFTLGNSGQTNISYTEWQGINPTVRGPWAGWIQVGFGATSKAYACWLLGVEFRADPDNAWDNW